MTRFVKIIVMFITTSILLNTIGLNANAAVCVDNGQIINSGYYRIQAITTNKYITVSNNSNKNGADLILSELSLDDSSNVFRLHHVSDNIFKIEAYCSGKMVEVESSSKKDRATIQQWSDNNKDNRQWYIEMSSDGYFIFKNKHSGLYMNIENNSTENGTPIIQYHWDDTSASKFILISLDTEDVKSATFTSYGDNVKYMDYRDIRRGTLWNNTRFGDMSDIPEEGQMILSNVIYLSHSDLHKILLEGSLKENKSLIDKLKDFSFNEAQDFLLDEFLGKYSMLAKLVLSIFPQEDYSMYNEVMKIISRVSQEDVNKGLVIKTYISFEEGTNANGKPSINEKCSKVVVDYWYPGYDNSLQREESNGDWELTFGYLEQR